MDHLEAEVSGSDPAAALLVVVVTGAGQLLVVRLVVALLRPGSAHRLRSGHQQHQD